MALETGSYISALVSTNPVGATDPKSQGDDHLRFIKAKILETFPNVTGEVTATHGQLNLVAGATGGLATLSVSFAALATLVSQMGTFSASVTSSDITGSIRNPVLQTQAGFTAGTFTAATVVVSNKGIITGISAGVTSVTGTTLTKNPYANSSTTTQAHGLSSTPTRVDIVLECLTADLNYSVGDKINLSASGYGDGAGNRGIVLLKDATNLVLIIGSATFQLLNKTTYGYGDITAANWKITATPYL